MRKKVDDEPLNCSCGYRRYELSKTQIALIANRIDAMKKHPAGVLFPQNVVLLVPNALT